MSTNIFNFSKLYYPQHGSYTSHLAGREDYDVTNFITCASDVFERRYTKVDRSRGPFFVDDAVTVRNLPLPHKRPVLARESRNMSHLCKNGFRWNAEPDVLVLSQQCGLPPELNTVFSQPPKSIMYAEFFVPSDIATRTEWPLHDSMRNSIELWRQKSLSDAHHADAIIVPTRHAKEMWPTQFQDKIHVVFDGIDTLHLAPKRILNLSDYGKQFRDGLPGKRIVAYIGRTLESIRGFDSWMKSYIKLRKQRDDLHFVVLGQDKIIQRGGGSEFYYGINSFKEWTLNNLGLEENALTDITWIPHLELYDFLSLVSVFDIVIYPMYGMFGNWSLFQALQMGAPIVASNRAYLPEVFNHGENGFLVDPDDIDDIVFHTLTLLDSSELQKKFHRNAFATIAQRYSVDIACRDFVDLLGELDVKVK